MPVMNRNPKKAHMKKNCLQNIFLKDRSTIMEIILWDFLMFYQIFLSPQVYELPHKLLNDSRLRILGKKEKSGESPNLLQL